ncbi:MAG: ABC transporter substrate-binding protein [Pseudomonadota bacterium]
MNVFHPDVRRARSTALTFAISGVIGFAALAGGPAAAQSATSESDPSAETAQAEDGVAKAENDVSKEEDVSAEDKATAFVRRLLDDAEAALTDEDRSDAARLAAFQDVLREGLALDALSKFIVSRSVYDAMTDAQRTRYDRAFPDYITRQYAEQFDGILGNPLEVTETKPFRKDIFVRTRFVRSEGAPLNVDWRTRSFSNGPLKLIDIVVNGASIMSVKRSEFASFVETRGVDALLDEIEKALPADAAAPESDPAPGDPAANEEGGDDAPPEDTSENEG